VGQRPSKFFKFPEFYKNDLTQFDNKQGANMISVEIPILTKKNNLVWLLMNETVIYNDSGEVIQFISIVSDITEKKEKEIDFERLSLVAKHTQNPIIILKNDLTIEWVNVAFVSEFGYQENEVYGFYPGKILKGQNSDKSKFTEFERIVVKGEKASGEFLLYNKSGQSIWVQASVDPVFDTDGNITKYICLMQNIQAVKDAQQIIASKNKDITDSINYAKRIQAALLPNLKLLRKNLPDFFIFYKPKDVVSGDFYYMEIIRNKVIIAIADCTGHGVPGAMMTSIGASGLNNAILDKKLSDPGKILEHLDLYVKSSLSARSEDITDGMDIGVIAFNFEKNTVEYCGAKRPLITFKANGEMQIIEGKKRSIGEFVFGEGSNFETTSISIKEDLSIYCFSDGITDQFGGANKKKLYIKYLLEFLESKQNLSMKAQEQAVQELLTTWTNDNEIPQTDDIVVFGAKVGNDYFNKMKKLISKSGI
jgi:PAS domain S-box-containing protein